MAKEHLVGLAEKLNIKPPTPAKDEAVAPAPAPAPAPVPVKAAAPPAPPAEPKVIDVPPELLGEKKETPLAPDVHAVSDQEIEKLPVPAQTAVRNQREHIKRLEQQLAERNKAVPVVDHTPELEKLKAQLAEASKELDLVALNRSPQFRKKYEEPRQAILEQIKLYMKEFGIEDETVADRAADASIRERVAILSEASGDSVSTLTPLFAQLDMLERQKQAELVNASEVRKTYEAQMRASTEDFRNRHFESSIKGMVAEGDVLLQEVADQPAWNENVALLKQTIKSVFESDDAAVQSKFLARGALAPVYRDLWKKGREEIQQLKNELAKYGRAVPRVNGTPVVAGPVSDVKGNMTPEAAAAALAARFRN